MNEWNWDLMRIGLPVRPHAQNAMLAPPEDEFFAREVHRSFDTWTDDPFQLIQKPFGAFLEPKGFEFIQAMKKPNMRSYQRHMPRTLGLARTIYQALPEVSVWGRQRPGGSAAWETITAGKWSQGVTKGRSFKFEQKAMSEWDVLKMLVSPEASTLANTDCKGDRFSKVKHVRIDIDMDNTFQDDGEDHLPELQGEITLVHDVFAAFGLPAVHVFRTGNRGIQAVAGIPWIDRSVAWVLTEMIRTVLKGSRVRDWRATDFKTALDGLMRLPLGLHKWSGSLGLFLGKDGMILPIEEQVDTFVNAFVERPDWSTDWAEEMRPRLGTTHEIPHVTLQEIVAEFPRNPIVRTFLLACDQFDVNGWEKKYVTHTNVGNPFQAHEGGFISVASALPSETVTHTKEIEEQTSSEGSSVLKASTLGTSPAKLKRIGWEVLNAGFEPGTSFQYYVNVMKGIKGKNSIGWALVVHDGDVEKAKEWLDDQAERITGSEADIAQRKALIAWGLELDAHGKPRNDTYERFQSRRINAPHREFRGEVTKADTEAAALIVSALPALRQERDDVKRKTFREDALVVIRHILELMMAVARDSPAGLIPVSDRTLAAEITRRWPDAATNAMTVLRQMPWITYDPAIAKENQNFLIEALEIVERPKKITDPTVYKLGPGM